MAEKLQLQRQHCGVARSGIHSFLLFIAFRSVIVSSPEPDFHDTSIAHCPESGGQGKTAALKTERGGCGRTPPDLFWPGQERVRGAT